MVKPSGVIKTKYVPGWYNDADVGTRLCVSLMEDVLNCQIVVCVLCWRTCAHSLNEAWLLLGIVKADVFEIIMIPRILCRLLFHCCIGTLGIPLEDASGNTGSFVS